ncbi:CHASE2 domain-containing protein [Solimonas soli]|uniref:CHASE2 domain-containing protein n=1 Tax=Solimonas soli TaxID=413479 RepID=UPI000485752E|nr:adenylate/guanylate cyclase domain-containing protein [Solimonas soli]
MGSSRTRIRFAISAVVLGLFLLHSARILPWRLLDVVEAFTYDARVNLTLPRRADPKIVIVDLDERSLAAEGQWPWTRDRLATLVDHLFDRYHIRVFGFDMVFAEADDKAGRLWQQLADGTLADLPAVAERRAAVAASLDYDARLAQALRGRPVVLGFFFKPRLGEREAAQTGQLCAPLIDAGAARLYDVAFYEPAGAGGNVPALRAAAASCGFFDNPAVDFDGVYRRVPLLQRYGGAIYPSLALEVARLALGRAPASLEFDPPDVRSSLHLERLRLGDRAVPVDAQAAAYVPYRGDNRTFRYVSATDVIRGAVADPAMLRDAVVLMGATAAGYLDLRSTPVNKVFAGVEVHASLVDGILNGGIRQKAPYYDGIEAVLLLLVALALAWAFSHLTAAWSALVGFGLVAALVGLALAFWSGAAFILPLGVPVVFALALFMAHLLYGYFIESRRARSIARSFGEYVPPEVVAEMAERGGAPSMEGESREMTVLFSDVRGFTGISERLEARELAQLMNAFLSRQTAVIHRYRGTIDKYMGDAIMAFWGAPLADERHAFHALQAGLDMLRAVRELDAEFGARGWPALDIGVGLNSGKMSVGNMGSEFRRAYTVMGDAVNLGSRVEGLTKAYGVAIICTQSTRDAAPGDWAFRELDLVRVKGKQEPVAIYEPFGPKDALDADLRQDLARHRGALKLYRAQRWNAAEQEFLTLLNGGRPHEVYRLFLERIDFLRRHPPGADWDGAFTFEHK